MRDGVAAPGRKRIAVALAAAAATLAIAAPASARQVGAGHDGRPNILVVMTDDMAATDLALMPKTRRLLVRQGTKFADAIDSFPLCCPARATFLTGQYAHNHGVAGNFYPYGWYGMKRRGNTLPRWLQKAGYRTGLIGKWLNGYGARDGIGEVPKGFDLWRGLLDVSAYDYYNFVMNRDGKLRSWGDAEFASKLVEFGNIEVVPGVESAADILAKLAEVFGPAPYEYWGEADPADYSPDVTGRMTARLVRAERRSRRPFFLWWSVAAPHREDVATTLMGRPGPDPRPAPRHAERSETYELSRPPSFNEADLSDKPSNLRDAAPPMSEEEIAQLELDYQGRVGSLLAVDDHVAKLVRTLRATDQLRNTVIVFLSDNGWLHGEHRVTGDKFLPYEESLRIPVVIRGPGVPRGRVIRGQVSNVDLAPTLIDIANATAGRTMDGLSLVPTMRDRDRRPDRALVIEAPRPLFEADIPVNAWDRPYLGVRTDRYTYVVWTETGETELYDLRQDPYQLENAAGDPAYASIEARLATKLERLADCAGRACNVRP
jgi:N-acetylglucosamine-6-sulfatase